MKSKFGTQDARQSEANREFKNQRHGASPWFIVALIGFTIIDFLSLSIWR
jgi:hypothetical protein